LKDYQEIIEIALDTIAIEAEAISELKSSVNKDFVRCVELIFESKGRVIVTGIGKSAIIGAKIVATLNSTGTPATFMHAADASTVTWALFKRKILLFACQTAGKLPRLKFWFLY